VRGCIHPLALFALVQARFQPKGRKVRTRTFGKKMGAKKWRWMKVYNLIDTFSDILKHYFLPAREDFRSALQSAMPKLLMNGEKSPKDEMKEVFDGMTTKNWKSSKAKLLTLWATI